MSAFTPSNLVVSPRAVPTPLAPDGVRITALAGFALFVLFLASPSIGFLGEITADRFTTLRHAQEVHADFEYFYFAAATLLDHGAMDAEYTRLPDGTIIERGGIPWYLPAVPRLMTVFVAAGRGLSAVFGGQPYAWTLLLWLTLSVSALVVTVRLIGRHLLGLPAQDWPVTMILPLVCLALFWTWEFRLNQIDNLTLMLLTVCFVTWQSGHRGRAGIWLGLAILLKLTPAILGVWFVLKRQWRTAIIAGATVLVVGPLADIAALGPGYAAEAYGAWLHRAAVESSPRSLVLQQKEMDWRNQSLAAVTTRWLHPTSYHTRFDNDPRIKYSNEHFRYINVASLPLPTVAAIAQGAGLLIVMGLLWLARKPARKCSLWQLRLEWAVFIGGMLLVMPVMRRYHLIWLLPSLALLGAAMHYSRFRGWWTSLSLSMIAVVFLAQCSLITRMVYDSHIAEGLGVLYIAAVAACLPLVLMIARLNRNPNHLPADAFAPPHPAGYVAAPPQDSAGRE